jgi:tetratricopeptide (TPR) repeat protein
MFGFEPDVFQAYANVASRMANQLTNLEYAIPLEETMKELKKQSGGEKRTNSMLGAVYDNLEKQVNFIRYPEKNWLVDGASYFSYLWFIAGNISSALVNTTQLPMVVMPLLGGKYGLTKSFAAMERAMSTYFNGSWDSNNGGKKAFPSDFTFGAAEGLDNKYKKLYNAAVSRSIIRRSTGYEITELQKAGVKDYVGTNARVVHGLGWLFQNSERFNREVTLLAAFDLAYEASGDVDKAIEEAIKVVNDAHGSALAETGPRLFQQGFGKVMFTFKRFAQAQIYLLSKLFKQAFKDADPRTREVARSQLIGVFGASFLIAGLQGMPLYGAVEFLANLLMGDDDEPYDFSAYVDSKYGVMGRKGLLNELIGLDIASRTGFNGMIWRDDHRRMAEVGPFLYALEQAMGPAYGAFLSGQRGYELFKEGEYMRSIEAITPSFIRNGFKTLRMAEEGVRNKDGTPIVEDISGYNLMMQLVGFTPSEVSAKREEASMESKLNEKLEKRRNSLLNQYAAAWMEKDREGVQEALRSIRAFNERNPMRPYFIKASTLRKSILDRREKQLMSVNGLYLSPYERYRVEQLKSGG